MIEYRTGNAAIPMVYAGIGSRKTPGSVLAWMSDFAAWTASLGWLVRSGGAVGADTAFETGARSVSTRLCASFGPDSADPASLAMAARFHPAWHRLSPPVQRLQARNCCQVLGANLRSPVAFVACWTPDGAEGAGPGQDLAVGSFRPEARPTSSETGGTGQAIRIANAYGIPVFNLASEGRTEDLLAFVDDFNQRTRHAL